MRRAWLAVWLTGVCAVACALDESGASVDADASSPGSAAASGSAGSGGDAGDAGVAGSSGSAATAGSAGSSPGGAGGSAGMGDNFPTALHAKRIELPCGAHSPPGCAALDTSQALVFEGTPGVTYDVTLRFRGVVEQNAYIGGSSNGWFYTGGQADNAGWNVYSISISNPAATYFLNSGVTGILYCSAIDYQETIPIAAGASITLYGDALDGQQVINVDAGGQPIVVPGVPPDPDAYDGQFIQIDVVSLKPQ